MSSGARKRDPGDEIVSVGVKRQHGIEKILGALLKAEIAAKQARVVSKTRKSAEATTRRRSPSCRSPRSWPTWASVTRRSTAI